LCLSSSLDLSLGFHGLSQNVTVWLRHLKLWNATGTKHVRISDS
jgi:hypothetical protein